MKIVLAGGTGFIGGRLLRALVQGGHAVTMLLRDPSTAAAWTDAGAAVRLWSDAGWAASVDGADVVVNLAGESVAAGRWTLARKERILRSRIDTTRALVGAIARAGVRPKALINASAVGYYGPRGGEALDESAPAGKGFLPDVCLAWEQEASKAKELGARVVLLRTGVVLGAGGGALARMLLPFRLGLGGRLGSGTQGFPWIHVDDEVGMILEGLRNPALNGPVNAVAPGFVTNAGFTKALGSALHRPTIAPMPAFVLQVLLGEMSEMLLTGQHVVPGAAQKAGYRFKFPTLDAALADILGRRGS